jgi:hypothetical protein
MADQVRDFIEFLANILLMICVLLASVLAYGLFRYFRRRKFVPIYKFNIVGGCIEGHYGSRFPKKHWLGTATALDIINPRNPIVSVVDGRELQNLNEISDHHEKNLQVGPLKE